MKPSILALILVAVVGLLSGCESSEEKAEKHYQSALALLAKGDEERAIVEFKNVFRLNGKHREARAAFADLLRERGNIRKAISNYLLIAEQYPADVDARRVLAELYAEFGNWEEMGRHLHAADELAPDDPQIDALQLVFEYQSQLESADLQKLSILAEKAQDMLQEFPDNLLLRHVIVDNFIRQEQFDRALEELSQAIDLAPDDRSLYVMQLQILSQIGDTLELEKALQTMIARFPEDDAGAAALVMLYLADGNTDKAEAFLRDQANSSDGDSKAKLKLISFLEKYRDRDTAISELEKMLAEDSSDTALHGLRAGYKFDSGNPEGAIADLRTFIETLEPSDDERKLKLLLVRMLDQTGEEAAARTLIDEILAADGQNVAALKYKGSNLIDADKPDNAVVLLRTALEEDPNDPEVLTLLARAHERQGNQELVGEMLALAYDVSDSAPAETLRYAQYLLELGKTGSAEEILIESLRRQPGNQDVLEALGELYVKTADWGRATQVQETLSNSGVPEAIAIANNLKNRILRGQEKTDEALAFLEGLIKDGAAGFGANVEIVRTYIAQGEPEKARAHVATLLEKSPDDPQTLFLDASIDAATNEVDSAIAKFRGLVEKEPTFVQAWVALYRGLLQAGRVDDAEAAVDEALAKVPDEPVLQWIKAGVLEKNGDLAGAIDIYEEMYARDSNNLVIANNLASLIATTKNDPEALERASRIAQRLRISSFPPYQDTYGWIAFLQGETTEALRALEPAAAGLPQDAMVQYHLAKAYLKSGRKEKALEQFRKVVALSDEGDNREFVLESRAESQRLEEELSQGQ